MLRILLLLGPLLLHEQASLAAPLVNCTQKCGGIAIPYPFGIGDGCFLDKWYEIVCQNDNVPILKKPNLRVLNISLPDLYGGSFGMMKVSLPITYSSNAGCGGNGSSTPVSLKGSQFIFSTSENIFAAVGCSRDAQMHDTGSTTVRCNSSCRADDDVVRNMTCSGSDGCYQTNFTSVFQAFTIHFQPYNETAGENECNYAFLGDRSQFTPSVRGFNKLKASGHFPAVLEWGIAKSSKAALEYYNSSSIPKSYGCSSFSFGPPYFMQLPFLQCYCREGFTGNPYKQYGCEVDRAEGSKKIKFLLIGVGSGLGALFLCLTSWRLYKYIKKIKETKLKEKYFKRNGGLLLERELSSPEGNVEKSKLFNSKDLEKATDNFNDDRILGQGGQGTVYKRMLTDGRIVAIKKSKVIDEGKVEQFINEVLILSQINHGNVVKLLGCCLETEVPLLVHEFIPNGTLYQYLHDPNVELPVSWDMRLRIATEVAGALFYLHSAASIPVYHRDIKSTNILLDEKFRAKVADFGTSKSVSLDQTHVTTLVQGTFGYLDPEYFQSSQFTDKNDVYSFGVVLVELLTGQMPISSRREEGRSLAMYFIISMEENRLFDIVDAHVLKEGKKEEIASVANLAKRCLNLSGRNRPTMKEVAMELEGIRKLQYPLGILQDQVNREATEFHDVIFTSSNSNVDMNVFTFSGVQPLLPSVSW